MSGMRPRIRVVAAVCSLFLLAACASQVSGNASTSDYADPRGPTVIGNDTSAESRVVAALYGALLTGAGEKVRMATTRYTSAADTTRAVVEGKLDLAPAYESTVLRALPGGQIAPGDLAATLSMALPMGIDALPPAAAQRGIVLAVGRDTARRHGLRTIADLRELGRPLTLGGPASGDPEAPSVSSLAKVYGVTFVAWGTSTATDVLVLRGTDPLIARRGLAVLADPGGVIAPEHVFPLVGAPYAGLKARKALGRVSVPLTTEELAVLTASVNAGKDPSEVARTWLRAKGLLG